MAFRNPLECVPMHGRSKCGPCTTTRNPCSWFNDFRSSLLESRNGWDKAKIAAMIAHHEEVSSKSRTPKKRSKDADSSPVKKTKKTQPVVDSIPGPSAPRLPSLIIKRPVPSVIPFSSVSQTLPSPVPVTSPVPRTPSPALFPSPLVSPAGSPFVPVLTSPLFNPSVSPDPAATTRLEEELKRTKEQVRQLSEANAFERGERRRVEADFLKIRRERDEIRRELEESRQELDKVAAVDTNRADEVQHWIDRAYGASEVFS
jgi:hypothetical protein